ncbi:MAG: DUF5663 domain-containing protein [Candidatus Magasanikbacteria bacterium]
MPEEQKQFDFLHEYILEVLSQSGYGELDETTKQEYVPQFVAHAETRIGAALLPELNEESAKKMVELTKNESVTSEDWQNFWQENVSGFAEIVKKTLEEFAVELRDILASLKK